jgi:hypothetical protein
MRELDHIVLQATHSSPPAEFPLHIQPSPCITALQGRRTDKLALSLSIAHTQFWVFVSRVKLLKAKYRIGIPYLGTTADVKQVYFIIRKHSNIH